MTKKECETALSKLWDNTFGTDCITGEDLDKYVDVIDGLIQYVFNPQPYKFEDLKEDVWVWDDVFKEMCFISSIIDRNKIYIEYLESHCSLEPCKILFFEEGRFFPITKVLEYQE